MFEFYNKHYIRIDENGYIIKGFSNAFIQPFETDICINEQGGRHYSPVLLENNGIPLYKWVDGEMVETTAEEKQTWIDAHPAPQPSIQQQLESTDRQMARIAEDLIAKLITKGVITDMDLPQEAREKIQQRQQLRSQLSS